MSHSIESIASIRKKTKENLRVESLVPLELREKAAPLIELLKDYYSHINERGQASYILNSINNERDIDFAELIVGNIERITVINGGSGYSNSPVVTITGDGIGAQAIAKVNNSGVIYAIDLVAGKKGWGYTNATVTITDTNGIGATAIATVSTASYLDLIQKEIAPAIPKVITAQRANLYKNLMKYYSVRGSTESIELFFKILFNDSAEIYYPKRDLLIPSSGKWQANLSRATYTPEPIIMVKGNGSKARAKAIVKNGAITSLDLDNAGDNYTTVSLNITEAPGGTGVGATAVAYTDYGKITNLTIVDPGSGYTTAAIQISDSTGGTGANAEAVAVTDYGKITDITVTHPGSGYTTASVIISGDGTGAKAYATLSTGGGINTIVVTDPGSGYTTATATIVGYTNREQLDIIYYVSTGTTTITAHASSSAAIAGIVAGDYITIKNAFDSQYEKLNGSWEITSVTSTTLVFDISSAMTAGTYYDVRMGKAEFGSNAVLSSTIGAGAITEVKIIDAGQNYVSPVINIIGPGSSADIAATIGTGKIISLAVTNPGANYTNPTVTVTGDGANGAVSANVVNGAIVELIPIEVGANYTNASVEIYGDGNGATAKAIIQDGEVTSYEMLSYGSGYTIPGVFLGFQSGIYNENIGFLSDDIKLQDSYFYQDYSYVVRTASNIEVWQDAFNKLVHPAGFIFFGQILVLIELLKQYAAMPDQQPGLISDEDIPVLILLYAFKVFQDNAAVTFQDTGNTVTRVNHQYQNGQRVIFYNISTTTGISANQPYYVINKTDDTFQLALTKDGSAINLVNNGSGTALRYSERTPTAIFTATINNTYGSSGYVLTVTNVTSGIIKVGMLLNGNSVNGTYITERITGTGGVGTYKVNIQQNISSSTYVGTASDSNKPLVGALHKRIALTIANDAASTTTLSYSTGTKTLTIGTGLSFATNDPIVIYPSGTSIYFMSGTVTSYDSGTGSLVVNITNSVGVGSASSWKVKNNTNYMLKFYDACPMETYRTMQIQQADGNGGVPEYSYDDYTINDVINNVITWKDVQLGANLI